MATRQVLPQELWLKVLNIFKKESSLHDLVFQWTTLRHVSKSFQGEIEKHFERAHLPSLRLHLATSRAVQYCLSHNYFFERDQDRSSLEENLHEHCGIIPGLRGVIGPGRIEPGHVEIQLKPFSCVRGWDPEVGIIIPIFGHLIQQGKLGQSLESEDAKQDDAFNASKSFFDTDREYPWIITRIAGSLHDCDLSSTLKFDPRGGTIRLRWKELFGQFLGAKSRLEQQFGEAPILDVSHRRVTVVEPWAIDLSKQYRDERNSFYVNNEVVTWRDDLMRAGESERALSRWRSDTWLDVDERNIALHFILQKDDYAQGKYSAHCSRFNAAMRTMRMTDLSEHWPEFLDLTLPPGFGRTNVWEWTPTDRAVRWMMPDTPATLLAGRDAENVDMVLLDKNLSDAHLAVEYTPALKLISIYCLGNKAFVQANPKLGPPGKCLTQGQTSNNEAMGKSIWVKIGATELYIYCHDDVGGT